MDGSIDLLGIRPFLESEQGDKWLRKGNAQDEAMRFYISHLLLQAWKSVFGKFASPAFVHVRKTPKKTKIFWSVSSAAPEDRTETSEIRILSIKPSEVQGYYEVKLAHKLTTEKAERWMMVPFVCFRDFDPFLQYWLIKDCKEARNAYSLSAGALPKAQQ